MMRKTFGEIARRAGKRGDPRALGVTRYVAGEHVRTDDFRVDFGVITPEIPGPAFTTIFEAGNILYGTRRTYLRKVGVPTFRGACANTTLALEAYGDDVYPEYLPWLMSSPGFVDFSVAASKGSVNPFVNWSDLVRFEFDLPSIEEQRRIVALLRAADASHQTSASVQENSRTAERAYSDKIWAMGLPTEKLSAVASVERGLSWDKGQERPQGGNGTFAVIRIPNLSNGQFRAEPKLWLADVSLKDRAAKSVNDSSILIVGSNGNADRVGDSILMPTGVSEYLFASFLIGIKATDRVDAAFIWLCWRGSAIRSLIAGANSGSTGLKNISLTQVREMRIPWPDRPTREDLARHSTALNLISTAAKLEMDAIAKLRSALLRELIG